MRAGARGPIVGRMSNPNKENHLHVRYATERGTMELHLDLSDPKERKRLEEVVAAALATFRAPAMPSCFPAAPPPAPARSVKRRK